MMHSPSSLNYQERPNYDYQQTCSGLVNFMCQWEENNKTSHDDMYHESAKKMGLKKN